MLSKLNCMKTLPTKKVAIRLIVNKPNSFENDNREYIQNSFVKTQVKQLQKGPVDLAC